MRSSFINRAPLYFVQAELYRLHSAVMAWASLRPAAVIAKLAASAFK